MLQILAIISKVPAILSIIHQIVLLVEAAFPKASGAQKLDAAVSSVGALLPTVADAASNPAVQTLINLVVGLLNKPGGTFADAKNQTGATGG